MSTDYRTVIEEGHAETEVKKSHFLAIICHVASPEEAEEILRSIKKKYYDASHSCSAYILNSDQGLRHSSDDGEPSGTAGKPILDVISGAGLSDTMIVVTRYFGGTLLGTGGLVRAYSGAAAEVVRNATIVDVIGAELTEFSLDYSLFPKLDHILSEMGIVKASVEYLDTVNIGILLKLSEKSDFYKQLIEATAGIIDEKAVKNKKECMYYINNGSVVLL